MFALLIAKVLPAIAAYAMNLFHYTCNHVARVGLHSSVDLELVMELDGILDQYAYMCLCVNQ